MLFPSLILSLVAAASIWLLGRRNPARDPRVTGGILFTLLLLPLLSLLPKQEIQVSAGTVIPTMSWSYAGLIWLSGVAFFSLRGLFDVIAMSRWKKEAQPMTLDLFEEAKAELNFQGQVALCSHPTLSSPVVSGLMHPTIYLPENASQWPQETLKMALLHELSHLQRHDLWMASTARLACIFHWFNPLVWWLRKALLSQCEYACDAYLMQRGTDRKTYAHALCDVAENSATPPLALAMAGHVPLRERIVQLSGEKKSGSILLSTLLAITASSAIAMSVIGFVEQEILIIDPEVTLRLTANPFPLD